MERKASSPMAPTFMVSAPGKVIRFGEHAAVYGKPAIAAAISLRSYLLVTTLSKSQRTITLNLRDIGLYHTWSIDDLPWRIFQQTSKKKFYHSMVTTLDPDLLDAIKVYAAAVSIGLPGTERKVHVRSATAFLYLYLSLGSSESPGAVYTLRSTIPIGAGLGSSASVCVCLSTALLPQIHALAGPHLDQPPEEAKVQIEHINYWAFVGELCMHGNPSGVDNTISAGGKAVVFQKQNSGISSVIPFPSIPALPILLVDTRQPRSTAVQVEQVRALKDKHPEIIGLVLEGIGALTMSAMELVLSANFNSDDTSDGLSRLGNLMRMNHGLLVSLGASHPRLERVCELVDRANIGWTKLTGSGGGGCTITLFRPDTNVETIRTLRQRFTEDGFRTYETTLGAEGVGVLWPAVYREGVEVGEEIDQEKFENANGDRGIEQLVGVGGGVETRHGWKFWTRTVV